MHSLVEEKSMNFLSFDIGTTCCKCQLFTETGEIKKYLTKEYEFLKIDNENYVDIKEIWNQMKKMIKEISEEYTFDSLAISTFGEAFVLLDQNDNILFYPMLYTDPRGEEEVKEILNCFTKEEYFKITGAIPHSMYSLAKLLWIRKHYPEKYKHADKLLLICDYLGYLLTGKRVIDYALASRTNAFDIEKKEFSKTILDTLNIPLSLFSKPKEAGTIVGSLSDEIKNELGIKNDVVLVLGSQDQICSALGAGAIHNGEAVDGMGTVECITSLFPEKVNNPQMGKQGYVCVPYPVNNLYCVYVLNYSCSSMMNWYRHQILHDYQGKEDSIYSYLERDISLQPNDLLVLPYFGGAATPYQNINAKGAILNLKNNTTDSEIYQAFMEGLSMEMRLNEETIQQYGIYIHQMVATGGGANSKKWLNLKANIEKVKIRSLRSSEGGLCGCAIFQSIAMKSKKTYDEAVKTFVQYKDEFIPEDTISSAFEGKYQKYKKLYNTLKEFN